MELTFNQAKEAITASIACGDKTPTLLLGPPGAGKTTLAIDVAESLGIPRSVAWDCVFRPSFREPVDLMGAMTIEDGTTRWARNGFFEDVNRVAETYGFALLIWDELPQAPDMLQNAIAGALHDWRIGSSILDPRVYQVATGNRVEDKAGARRVLTQVADRLEQIDFGISLDDWIRWGLTHGLDPMLLAYHRFNAGKSLHDFDPARRVNATPRSWEQAAKVPTSLPAAIYTAKVAGRVGEGHAQEYLAFRQFALELPTREEVLFDPAGARIPEAPGAKYAAAFGLAKHATPENFDRVAQYLMRYPTELQVAVFRDLEATRKDLVPTSGFIAWACSPAAAAMM